MKIAKLARISMGMNREVSLAAPYLTVMSAECLSVSAVVNSSKVAGFTAIASQSTASTHSRIELMGKDISAMRTLSRAMESIEIAIFASYKTILKDCKTA